MKRLFRSVTDRKIAGVCGGAAEYFSVDPVIIRIIMIALGIWGAGIVIYIVAWIIVPEKPEEIQHSD